MNRATQIIFFVQYRGTATELRLELMMLDLSKYILPDHRYPSLVFLRLMLYHILSMCRPCI